MEPRNEAGPPIELYLTWIGVSATATGVTLAAAEGAPVPTLLTARTLTE